MQFPFKKTKVRTSYWDFEETRGCSSFLGLCILGTVVSEMSHVRKTYPYVEMRKSCLYTEPAVPNSKETRLPVSPGLGLGSTFLASQTPLLMYNKQTLEKIRGILLSWQHSTILNEIVSIC